MNYLREFGKFRLDAKKKVLWFEDEPVNLQLKEIELLCALTENSGEVVTKDELLNKVWAESFVEESNLSRHIYQIRKVFKDCGATNLIQTVPRRGYRFTGEMRGNDSDFIIEKHSLTRTLIEELETSEAPELKTVTGKILQTGMRRLLIPVLTCLAILVIVSGIYFYNRSSVQAGALDQPIRSIAVLPLRALSGEDDEALSLGFADALITSLGKLDNVKIISTNTVSRYLDGAVESIEIGKNLGVDAVVEGSLQRAGGKLRVTLRLIRVADGKQIWTGAFDQAESEIFSLQDAMAAQTAEALSLNLKPKTGVKRPTANLDAYNNYLQGEYFFRRRENIKSRAFFKKAVELDPQFARAWAGLAAVYAMRGPMEQAEATVNRALELEPDLAEAHAVRGFIKMFLDWNWTEAEKSLDRAVALDPNSVEAHHWRGIYLGIQGRFDEAKAEYQRAMELDPTSANLTSDLGQIYYLAHEFDKAEEFYRKAETMQEYMSAGRLIELYERQGRQQEAFETRLIVDCRDFQNEQKSSCLNEIKAAFESDSVRGIGSIKLKFFLKTATDKETAGNWIASAYYGAAIWSLRFGEKEKSLDYLKRSLETKNRYESMNFTAPFIAVDPTFDEVREESGFKEILKKINL